MSRAVLALAVLASLLPAAARAAYDPNLHVDPGVDDCSVRFAPELTQSAFHRFVREFGSVSALKPGSSPDTLRPGHASLDVQELFFSVEEKSAAWNDTFTHPDATHELGAQKAFPELKLRVGAAEDVELGAFYTRNFQANYGWLGVDAKYRALDQRRGSPVSLALRAAYTKTLYVRDMDMHAVGADASIGRTFWDVVTPYAGVGADAVLARETSGAVELKDEATVVPRLTAGVEARWRHVGLGVEANLSALTSYQVHVSGVL